jgi:uncharacterized protein YunC (DUF1805 family)
MVEIKQIKLKEGTALGIKIMKDEKGPLVVLIKAEKGFIVCSNFNMKALEEKGVVAARVAGINSIETALETNIVEITSKAKEIGLKEGMPVKEALEKLC